jgi:hypothetical protein
VQGQDFSDIFCQDLRRMYYHNNNNDEQAVKGIFSKRKSGTFAPALFLPHSSPSVFLIRKSGKASKNQQQNMVLILNTI